MALANDTQAPDFELANQFGERVRLSEYRGHRAVALVFFPLAFSGTCTGEMCQLEEKGFANRATFLIDTRGIIRGSFITAPGEARELEAYRTAIRDLALVPA